VARRIGTLIISADRRPFLDGSNPSGDDWHQCDGSAVGTEVKSGNGRRSPQLSSRIASTATAPTPSCQTDRRSFGHRRQRRLGRPDLWPAAKIILHLTGLDASAPGRHHGTQEGEASRCTALTAFLVPWFCLLAEWMTRAGKTAFGLSSIHLFGPCGAILSSRPHALSGGTSSGGQERATLARPCKLVLERPQARRHDWRRTGEPGITRRDERHEIARSKCARVSVRRSSTCCTRVPENLVSGWPPLHRHTSARSFAATPGNTCAISFWSRP
jgi:hypothetical protein